MAATSAPSGAPAPLAQTSSRATVLSLFAQLLKKPEAQLDTQQPFAEFGVDSFLSLKLNRELEKRFGKKIVPTVNVDPELVGGARITVGDTVIDASVRAQLQAMANQLRS